MNKVIKLKLSFLTLNFNKSFIAIGFVIKNLRIYF